MMCAQAALLAHTSLQWGPLTTRAAGAAQPDGRHLPAEWQIAKIAPPARTALIVRRIAGVAHLDALQTLQERQAARFVLREDLVALLEAPVAPIALKAGTARASVVRVRQLAPPAQPDDSAH